MIAYTCACGHNLNLEENQVGGLAECPGCGAEIAVPDAPHLEEANRLCPVCGTRRWRNITTRRAFRKKMPRLPAKRSSGGEEDYNTPFFFSLPRECRECGTIWLPPAPAWTAVFVILVGMAVRAIAGAIYVFSDPDRGGPRMDLKDLLEILLAGGGVLAFGFHILRGKKAGARLLKIGGWD